jgi:hypothetical protein
MLVGKAKIKNITVEATVIRKDGTVEKLGVIARSKKPGLFASLLNLLRKVNKNA